VAAPPQPAVAPPPPQPVAAPAPAPQITSEQIEAWAANKLNEALSRDTQVQGWIGEWNVAQTRIGALGADLTKGGAGEIATFERNLIAAQAYLARPEVQGDEYAKGQAESHVRDLKADLMTLRLERQTLEGTSQDLDRRYRERHQHYDGQLRSRIEAYQDEQGYDGRVNQQAATFQQVWDPAFTRVAAAKGIVGEKALAQFKQQARLAALYQVDSTGAAFKDTDIEPFIAAKADEFLAVMDDHHRMKSGEYARLAAERAGQPAPVPGAGGPPPAAEPRKAPTSLDDVYKNTRLRLDQHRRGVA
jgi:hypothetical protein